MPDLPYDKAPRCKAAVTRAAILVMILMGCHFAPAQAIDKSCPFAIGPVEREIALLDSVFGDAQNLRDHAEIQLRRAFATRHTSGLAISREKALKQLPAATASQLYEYFLWMHGPNEHKSLVAAANEYLCSRIYIGRSSALFAQKWLNHYIIDMHTQCDPIRYRFYLKNGSQRDGRLCRITYLQTPDLSKISFFRTNILETRIVKKGIKASWLVQLRLELPVNRHRGVFAVADAVINDNSGSWISERRHVIAANDIIRYEQMHQAKSPQDSAADDKRRRLEIRPIQSLANF